MPSPFPGMNPFLELPEFWSEFHSRMIVAIADQLSDQLSTKYRVAVEKRVYLSENDESVLIGIPDVAITSKATSSFSSASTALMVDDRPQAVAVEIPVPEEVQERFLEIREVPTGRVITIIELLSPKNKRSGEGRNAYLKKRQEAMLSQTHWVEIDLLRAGEPLPMNQSPRSEYRILVSRSEERPRAWLYGFSLKQTIPTIDIPLNETPAAVMDLQVLLHQIYDRARFGLAIDYQTTLTPKLGDSDRLWMQDFV